MRVRKHAKKITALNEKILEDGEMNTREIHDWLNERIRMGVTMNWVSNVLAKCGLFDKIGEEKVSGMSTRYSLAIWDSRSRQE
tara:strand:+ start:1573 stop:1821 length:249 start_codon:yes stop_codon:yes gene_type:complete